jgi:hypothetical protein
MIVKPGPVRVSGWAGRSVITMVEPGCISVKTRRAISGASSIRFMVSEARRAEAETTFVPAGKPTASHLRWRGSESGPVSVKAWVPNGFSGD